MLIWVETAPSGFAPSRLGKSPVAPQAARALFLIYPADGMKAWRVSSDVGNVRNNRPDLILQTPDA